MDKQNQQTNHQALIVRIYNPDENAEISNESVALNISVTKCIEARMDETPFNQQPIESGQLGLFTYC